MKAFAATLALVALALSPALAETAIPQFQVDPFWPKPLPNNWILGQVSGIAVDRLDRIWVVHRPGSLNARERAAEQNPPEAKCCVAAPPVLVFDQSGNLLGAWGGPGRLRMAGERARHLHRRQRFRLARRQRQEGRPAAEIHHGRQVRPADRQAGPRQRQQLDRAARLAGRRRGRRRRERGVRRRRLRQSPRRRVRSETGAYKRHWGAYGNRPSDEKTPPYDPGKARPRSSSAIRCTASASPRTGWSMCATAPTTACRFSARTAPSCPSMSTRRRRAAPARSTIWCSRPTRRRNSST